MPINGRISSHTNEWFSRIATQFQLSGTQKYTEGRKKHSQLDIGLMMLRKQNQAYTTSTSTRWYFAFAACFHVHRLQIRPIMHNYRWHPLPLPQVTSTGPCNSVGMRPQQTDRHQTHRRAWPQYISRRLRLTRNVIMYNGWHIKG